jgi:Tol biopolymer transport system component
VEAYSLLSACRTPLRQEDVVHRSAIVAIAAAASLLSLSLPAATLAAKPATFPGDNGKIAFVSGRDGGNPEADVYILDSIDDTTPTKLTSASGQHRHPSWSPDGTKITYALWAGGGTVWDIWIHDLATNTSTNLTNSPSIKEDNPSWSPDGTRIAFDSEVSPGSGQTDILITNLETGATSNLTDSSDLVESRPAWSPDGKWIYYSRRGTASGSDDDIYRELSNDGGTPDSVVSTPEAEYQVAVSPNGQRICWTQGPYGSATAQVYVRNVDGSGGSSTPLSDGNPLGAYNCAWSPDGIKIAYALGIFGGAALVVEDANSVLIPPVVVTDATGVFDGNPDWAPAPGTGPVKLAITPESKDFGIVAVGGTSASQTFKITSTGTFPLHLGTLDLGGANPGQFQKNGDNCTGAELAQDEHCTVTVTFQPTSAGAKSAALTFPSDAPSGPRRAALTGTTPVPAVGIAPASKAFGDVQVGQTSAARTFTVTNTGSAALNLGVLALGGENPDQFTKANDGCTNATVAAGSSCTVDVSFKPTSTSTKSGQLRVPSDAASSVDLAGLTGNGTVAPPPAAPAVGIGPASKAFGDVVVGGTSAARTFTITNTGSAPLHLGALTLGGTSPDQFAKGTDGCSNATVAAGSSCTVDVSFKPTSTGARTGELRVPSDAASSPDTAGLTGNGTPAPAPAVGIAPVSKAFGDVVVGGTSAARTFTITNTGSAALHVGALTLGGANADQFATSADGCSNTTVAAGTSCTVDVSFAPTSAGAKTGTLRVPSDAVSSPDTAGLTGSGTATPPPTAPAVGIAPASKAFGDIQVGQTSAARTFIITNTGSAALHLGTLTLGGANAGQFSKANDTCSDTTVAISTSCTVDVSFAPTSTGSRSGELRVPSDATSSPDTAGLTGTGTPAPVPAVSIAPVSKAFGDVQVGQSSAARTFTVSSAGSAVLHLGTLTLGGANVDQFSKANDGCSNATVAAGSSCTVDVSFAPTSAGAKSAELRVPSDAASSTDTAGLTGTGTSTPPPAARPDGLIRLGSRGLFVGDNLYNVTGVGQGATGSAPRNGTITVTVKIQNDGASATKFTIRATGTASKSFDVKYFKGKTDITAAVEAGTYQTPMLAPTKTVLITAKVTVKGTAKKTSLVTRLVTVTSVDGNAVQDSVKLTGKRQ